MQESVIRWLDMSVRDDGRYYTDDSFMLIQVHISQPRMVGKDCLVTLRKKCWLNRVFVYLKTLNNSSKKDTEVEYRNLARTGVSERCTLHVL